MASPFQNQVVWITGASSGIGEAMAKDFVARGAKVILTARRKDRLDALAKKLNEANSAKSTGPTSPIAKVLVADLSQIDSLPKLADQALTCFGHVDVLFNNAGISQRSLVADTPFEVEARMIQIDLLVPIALTKALLPHFIGRKSGRILVTSSLMGELELPGSATYSCVKHALNGYFYSMAFEMEPLGIQVQVLEPGFVKTEISESAITSTGGRYGKMDSTQANAMSAETFSQKVFPLIEKGKTRIIVGGKERFAIPLKRWAPSLYRVVIKNFGRKMLRDRLGNLKG